MTKEETITKLDGELLRLMLAVSKFTQGKATLDDLRKAEEAAEGFRCWTAY